MEKKDSWVFGRYAMAGSLFVAHIWGTMLVWAVMNDKQGLVIGSMFEAVAFMIFSILAVMVGGKAWKEFAPLKWGEKDEK